MSINVVTISGNLTRSPEVKVTHGGTSILSFGMAVNDRRKNSSTGEWENYANFVDCVLFGKRSDYLSKKLQKGTKVFVQGKLHYTSYERNGEKRGKIEVIVDDLDIGFGSKSNDQQQGNYSQQQQYAPQNDPQQPTVGYQQQPYTQDVYSSDIPF